MIKDCRGVKGCKGIRGKKIDINDAEHPIRQKAIEIMEWIAEYLNKPTIFDCKNGDTKWYDIEDKIVNIIKRRVK